MRRPFGFRPSATSSARSKAIPPKANGLAPNSSDSVTRGKMKKAKPSGLHTNYIGCRIYIPWYSKIFHIPWYFMKHERVLMALTRASGTDLATIRTRSHHRIWYQSNGCAAKHVDPQNWSLKFTGIQHKSVYTYNIIEYMNIYVYVCIYIYYIYIWYLYIFVGNAIFCMLPGKLQQASQTLVRR